MTTTRFTAPTRIIAGLGARRELAAELGRIGSWPVALVADRGLDGSGLLEPLIASVTGGAVVPCALIGADPSVEEAEAAARRARQAGCRAVLAVGGGSALGAGKAVALRLHNDGPIGEYEGRDRAPMKPAPCVAIPTTAGSGSEVSDALVLHDAKHDRVVVVRGNGYQPTVAMLDGELLVSLPDVAMLHAGLDALSHALEALWVRGASRFTSALALRAADDICVRLPRALTERRPGDLQGLIEASTMANLACGPAGLGLVHALASAASVRLPHGYQTGVLLPHVAAYNYPVLDDGARDAVDRAQILYDALPFPARFAPEDLHAAQGPAMVRAALANPFLANNRREAGAEDLRAILTSAGIPATTTLIPTTSTT